jgi:hypothetical protein
MKSGIDPGGGRYYETANDKSTPTKTSLGVIDAHPNR